ncbi:nitrogen regulation protein NR(I) [Castellaniella sp.]|uniref:nitrogen regulation protein NR(I) n=1 Tax=Castellaniella sp. TaxID=1955812 RepID=UPI00355DCC63
MSDTIWILDDDRSIRWVLEKTLQPEGYAITTFDNADDALNRLEAGEPAPDVLITDIRMPGTDGLHTLRWLRARYPDLPVIVTTAFPDLDAAVNSYQGGAFDYLPKPFDIHDVNALVGSALSRREAGATADAGGPASPVPDIIGVSAAMQNVFRAIGRLSQSSATVLINGASGTGKERVAQALHQRSARASRPFLALNMAAIPQELIESELFGHERGAFTGANNRRIGRFEQADGGTLFLDEIGDMRLDVQTRLLRVLQEGEFYRVGGTSLIEVDVRIIAATHQDLAQRVQEGRFRQDLFYRLNVINIRLPDLAQRPEDIPQLAYHFLSQAAREMGVEQKRLDDDVMRLLAQLPWPGNVRQLENLCRWLTVMVAGGIIRRGDLPDTLLADARTPVASAQPAFDIPATPAPPTPARSAPASAIPARTGPVTAAPPDWPQALRAWADDALAAGAQDLLARALPIFERTLIDAALGASHGKRQEAARRLGWGRNTLARKCRERPPTP